MCHHRLHILLLLLSLFSFALLSSVHGMPWGGPSSNHRGSSGGPSWNGGPEEDPRNIILHSNGNGKSNYGQSLRQWRY